ncbi:prephenate dehydratase [Capsaspora owczarzaki ATCC 30864]|uniref:prephenate dehydratase n=1 Tax=Capsaspora owczarzaki (strain ATCC 30864) TaxID=595528 RepID=UPI0003524892|nr:prephenate dehydratase [Capsaspora owczarzaki ATCC 30864]|eukprot:XP_004365133.2 prephenate dehydratase [Capsaspora owczarzaki ATCC 30864]
MEQFGSGNPGAYSEIAAKTHFDTAPDVTTRPCETFEQVFDLVAAGQVDFGFCPIENTLSGNFLPVYDLLLRRDVSIVGEFIAHDEHCLIAAAGTALSDVKLVYSHPHVLDQCEAFLKTLPATHVATTDTAGACQLIKAQNQPGSAAIASTLAASISGLTIIKRGIEDDANSSTRYIAIAKQAANPPSHVNAKTSMSVALRNQPGALFRALAAFALRDLNISKIESRPSSRAGALHTSTRQWEYMYAIDVEANASQQVMINALSNLEEFATKVKVLGCYPIFVPRGTPSSLSPFGL